MAARLVAFVGPDGSGKTTQARIIRDRIASNGLRARLVYGRVVPVLSRPLLWAALLFRRQTTRRRTGGGAGSIPPHLAPPASWLFNILYTLDMIIQGLVKFRLGAIGRDVVVTDRYVHDSLITDFAVHLGWDGQQVARRYERITRRWLPRPDLVVRMTVSPQLALARKSDITSEVAYQALVALYEKTVFPDSRQVKLDTANGVDVAVEAAARAIREELGVSA